MINNNHCCRKAVENDISSVANIHLAAFEGFFLSQLGYEFLCIMYLAFIKSPNSIFVVLETSSGQIIGFAVGTVNGQKDLSLAIRYLPHFIMAAVPSVLRHPVKVLKRLCARLIESAKPPQMPNNSAFLRSIAVLPSKRVGAGSGLLQFFEDLALEKGAKNIFLMTDEFDNERAQRFYERCGYSLHVRFQQDRERWMWLMSKNVIGKS